MSDIYNIYCDESCHLANDGQSSMLLGCTWCKKESVKELSAELKRLKNKYNSNGELKWTKVSKSREEFFEEIVKWFFINSEIHFRALVVPDKSILDHDQYNDGSHDTFYYKMYFSLLNKILSPTGSYNIYIDIKDTRSKFKVKALRDVLCNDKYDFTKQMISGIQHVRSHEIELLQLTDFLLGAVAYKNRTLSGSETKIKIVKKIEELHKREINYSTSLSESKFNIFVWRPSE